MTRLLTDYLNLSTAEFIERHGYSGWRAARLLAEMRRLTKGGTK